MIWVYVCLSSGGEEDETDGYEIIETSGSRNLVEQLITMDLAERPAVQQITIGGISGWYVNTGVYRQDGIFPHNLHYEIPNQMRTSNSKQWLHVNAVFKIVMVTFRQL